MQYSMAVGTDHCYIGNFGFLRWLHLANRDCMVGFNIVKPSFTIDLLKIKIAGLAKKTLVFDFKLLFCL